MLRLLIIFLFVFTLLEYNALAQVVDTSEVNTEDPLFSTLPPPDTSDFDFFFTEEEKTKFLSYKPIIGIGYGAITFLGDVRDVYYKNYINGRFAPNLNITKGFRSFLDVKFNMIYGKLTGNERSLDRNLNFQTEFFNAGVQVSYNFEHLLKKDWMLISYKQQRRLIPYLSIGIESFGFNSKIDMKDGFGNKYFYWSDGTIRNITEAPGDENNSIILQRDYTYETDIRTLDNDGLGPYNLNAFAIPIDFCVEFQIHERVQLQLGASYHWALNDLIDDISNIGEGNRKGNNGGDNFFYSYFTFKLDIFSSVKIIEDSLRIIGAKIDYDAIVLDDEDNDGVNDLFDNCPFTPESIPVDSVGCPLDDDKDGIPNYRDDEINSPKDSIVGTNGVMLTEEERIAMSTPAPAVESSMICKYYPSMCGKSWKLRSKIPIPNKYQHLDLNDDNYISLEELSKAIDKFFDFDTDMTIDDVYELADFFFKQ